MGGSDLDLVLVNLLIDHFNGLPERQGKADVRGNVRAVKRLFKEVAKIKDVLSANSEVQVKISELADYISINYHLEREEFEKKAE